VTKLNFGVVLFLLLLIADVDTSKPERNVYLNKEA